MATATTITVRVDTRELDAAIEKVQRLRLLEEANACAGFGVVSAAGIAAALSERERKLSRRAFFAPWRYR